jgi:ABC-type lipoprotein release transport system permease subunit
MSGTFMWFYIKLAWRNMLRHKRRSLIAGTAIGIGLASLIFVDALVIGMEKNMVEAATSTFLGEGQIQRKGFRTTQQADLTVNRLDWIMANLGRESLLKHFAVRVMSYGVISSPANLSSVEMVGIDPEEEKDVSEIDEALIKGDYFAGENPRDIVIGEKLAEIMQVDLGDRMVLTVSQAGTGVLSQDLFRVSGIFRFNIPEMDRGMVFVRLPKAQEILGIGKNVHSIVLRFKDPRNGSDASLPIWKKYSRFGNEAIGWPVIMPQLEAVFKLSAFSIYLIGLILFGVVALGIVNTLFMSLHERIFEFGVLRAIGTRPTGMAKLILCEAGSLALVSIVLGCILGFIITLIVATTGIDYTGIEYVGVTFRKLIYPVLDVRQFVEYPLWVFVFTVCVGLYPAIHAARMSPAAAMRRSF